MAGASQEDKKVEHRVYILHFVEAVKNRTYNVGNTLAQNPQENSERNRLPKLFHSNNNGKPHKYKTYSFYLVMLFKSAETHNGSGNGT